MTRMQTAVGGAISKHVPATKSRVSFGLAQLYRRCCCTPNFDKLPGRCLGTTFLCEECPYTPQRTMILTRAKPPKDGLTNVHVLGSKKDGPFGRIYRRYQGPQRGPQLRQPTLRTHDRPHNPGLHPISVYILCLRALWPPPPGGGPPSKLCTEDSLLSPNLGPPIFVGLTAILPCQMANKKKNEMDTVFMGQELGFMLGSLHGENYSFLGDMRGTSFFGNSHFKTCVLRHARSDWSPGCDELQP